VDFAVRGDQHSLSTDGEIALYRSTRDTMAYGMAPAVEASSLSALTEIASNPPAHPKAGAGHTTPPLVLYIARVPGSRDVFLTPLKPREKVVSAEDVLSALYYVHVNTLEDSHIVHLQQLSSANADATQLPSVQENEVVRKPVPPPRSPRRASPDPQARYFLSDGHHLDRQRRPPSPLKRQITRKPVLSDITNSTILHTPTVDLPDIPRRPLPPPPTEEDDRQASLHADNVRLPRRSEHSSDNNPYLRTYEMQPSAPPVSDPAPEVGSLTLIRRDPASSSQWNVASIHDPPVQEVSSAALLSPSTAGRRVKKGGAPLYLDITNQGYLQFASGPRLDGRVSTSTNDSDISASPEGIFRRRLYMPGSRHADHGYSHKSTPATSRPSVDEVIPRTMRSRNSIEPSPYPDLTPSAMDRRSKGYSFTSPWDGRCDFSTSTSGKALKCRHQLSAAQGGNVLEVSELRFNLPTSSKPGTAPTSTAEKRASYFSGLHRRMRSDDSWGGGPSPGEDGMPSFVFDKDGRLDLTLGQERAGGGFGGKQAKLGKLIIYSDGVGMLDLLVAANVGLWWRAWERV